MFATLFAVLALAGAPATTHVECDPGMTMLGLTVASTVTVRDGRIVDGRLDRIFLGPIACGALLYTSASPNERRALRRLNPRVDFDQLVGVGLQVTLHEATHVALNSADECHVERVTRARVNDLFALYADHPVLAEHAADRSDMLLPPEYHNC